MYVPVAAVVLALKQPAVEQCHPSYPGPEGVGEEVEETPIPGEVLRLGNPCSQGHRGSHR